MSVEWYPGIRDFCRHWPDAPMLQQTFDALEQALDEENDACIDAARAMVECACKVILKNIQGSAALEEMENTNPNFGAWVSASVRALGLGEDRDRTFQKLVSQYHKLTEALGDLRNAAGTLSHGRDGFISKLSVHQRRAAVLAADAVVAFLHEAYLETEPDPALSYEPYSRFKRSNGIIDRYAGGGAYFDDDGVLQAGVLLPNGDEIELTVPLSALLFGLDREAYKQALNTCRDMAALDTQEPEESA